MAKFELIKEYANCPELLPVRSTAASAGYDFFVAEDIIIPSYNKHCDALFTAYAPIGYQNYLNGNNIVVDLETMANLTKTAKAKPTLVPTGVKIKLPTGTFLQLSVRSSCPLKNWLILANGVGIIDSDYYGNKANDGHIFFQIINLSPFDIQLKKGDRIGQGIILPFLITEDDKASGERTGGFGSTQ